MRPTFNIFQSIFIIVSTETYKHLRFAVCVVFWVVSVLGTVRVTAGKRVFEGHFIY